MKVFLILLPHFITTIIVIPTSVIWSLISSVKFTSISFHEKLQLSDIIFLGFQGPYNVIFAYGLDFLNTPTWFSLIFVGEEKPRSIINIHFMIKNPLYQKIYFFKVGLSPSKNNFLFASMNVLQKWWKMFFVSC